MTGTEHFKQAIKAYLDERAKTDELFAVSYAKVNKNLNDCVTFILNQAKAIAQEGGCGMTDDEVYSLATHYYDEDNIEVGKAINCGVIVNHRVELSEQEKAEAREKALKAYQAEELRKIQQHSSRPKPTPKAVKQEVSQPSLFDFE
ncbi:MAG: PcfK-like family protein [Prevotellaceae bacterium]|nr:PcfK-like family protein [Prevotellaceae bacterium]MDO4932017.1 PcfK-like family protein [Prevotellaceae bacterium]